RCDCCCLLNILLLFVYWCAYIFLLLFFFSAPPTTEIYTLSLHDALPISPSPIPSGLSTTRFMPHCRSWTSSKVSRIRETFEEVRSEEHTSELQSLAYLVCRLLLEKKNNKSNYTTPLLELLAPAWTSTRNN